MTIQGVCPECGMKADLSAFVSQGENNQALAAALEIPAPLGARMIRYLGLFRPVNKALSGRKAARLLSELRDVIASGEITRNKTTRPASLSVWSTALDLILERPPSGLPLSGHGYLYEIVAGEADKAQAMGEQQREQSARRGDHNLPVKPRHRERSTEEVLAEHKRMQGRKTAVTNTGQPHRLADLLKNAPSAKGEK